MRRFVSALILFVLVAVPVGPVRSYTLQYTNSSATILKRWPAGPITIALSSSLNSPPANVRVGSDVIGAARRALARWSEAANIDFNIVTSGAQAPVEDGVSLITFATGPTMTTQAEQPGRARITFDPTTGAIVEGDVVLHSNLPSGFSTDGTPNTYDIEATLMHEIGHMLGLEHSGVVGATMQPRQGRNDLYGLPALTMRTLADDDRAGVRALYGPLASLGAITGTVRSGSAPLFGAHVFAEEITTGRVRGGNVTLTDGRYRIDGLPAGQYRLVVEYLDEPIAAGEIASRSGAYTGLGTTTVPFRTFEAPTQVSVTPGLTMGRDITVNAGVPVVNATLIGLNLMLSTIPVPVVPGRTFSVYVGGQNVHQVGAAGVSVTSPFMSVNQATVTAQTFGSTQVLIFNVSVDIATPPGEYSIRLQSNTGEVTYVTGGLVVDLPFGVTSGNPLLDNRFFVAQHYRDFLGREADPSGFGDWVRVLDTCANRGFDPSNPACDRVHVSHGFFGSPEFGSRGYSVYRYFDAVLGRLPSYIEFTRNLQRVSGLAAGAELEAAKLAFVNDMMQQPEFQARYSGLTGASNAEAFVTSLETTAGVRIPEPTRAQLVAEMRDGRRTAAQTVLAFIETQTVFDKFYFRGFVAMQYFGYLKRDPDPAGFNGWVDLLTNGGGGRAPGDYRHLIYGFVYSHEYARRFGQV